jgi:hypothetical protein
MVSFLPTGLSWVIPAGRSFFLDTIEDKVKRVKGKAKSVCCFQKVLFAWKFLHYGIMPG